MNTITPTTLTITAAELKAGDILLNAFDDCPRDGYDVAMVDTDPTTHTIDLSWTRDQPETVVRVFSSTYPDITSFVFGINEILTVSRWVF